jgi:hypothetical protein
MHIYIYIYICLDFINEYLWSISISIVSRNTHRLILIQQCLTWNVLGMGMGRIGYIYHTNMSRLYKWVLMYIYILCIYIYIYIYIYIHILIYIRINIYPGRIISHFYAYTYIYISRLYKWEPLIGADTMIAAPPKTPFSIFPAPLPTLY